MSTEPDDRRGQALTDLVRLRVPLAKAIAAVRSLPWDSEVELTWLTRADAVNTHHRYVRGQPSAGDVELLADAVEGRDDIGLEPQFEELLSGFVFEMANPTLVQSLSVRLAAEWIRVLDTGGHRPAVDDE